MSSCISINRKLDPIIYLLPFERKPDGSAKYIPEFESKGYYVWHATILGRPISQRVYPSDIESFVSWDTQYLWIDTPPGVHVLTFQGLADQVVHPYVLFYFSRSQIVLFMNLALILL